MCGRFVGNFATSDLVEELIATGSVSGVTVEEGVPPRVANYNTAPTTSWPVFVSLQGAVHLRLARWGLVPSWSKDPTVASKMINARSETLTEKPSFRNLVKSHRAIIPVSGFYEWERSDPTNKRPFYVPRADGRTMWIAGLWTVSPVLQGASTFTLITRESLADLVAIHDRSPVQLEVEDALEWLSSPEAPTALLTLVTQPLLAPYEVDRQVNAVRNNSPELVNPAGRGTLF